MTVNGIQYRKFAESERKKCWEKQVPVHKKHREYIQFNSILFIDQLRALKGQQENCTYMKYAQTQEEKSCMIDSILDKLKTFTRTCTITVS